MQTKIRLLLLTFISANLLSMSSVASSPCWIENPIGIIVKIVNFQDGQLNLNTLEANNHNHLVLSMEADGNLILKQSSVTFNLNQKIVLHVDSRIKYQNISFIAKNHTNAVSYILGSELVKIDLDQIDQILLKVDNLNTNSIKIK